MTDLHDDYADDDGEDDTAADDGEWTEGRCDQCPGSTAEDLAYAATHLVPVCACAIGQGASAEDCRCGPHLFTNGAAQ